MENKLKITLAFLLFLCLLDMPYGYYQFVRLAGLIGFGILAYHAYQTQRQTESIIYGSLAVLFQPIFKIGFDRDIWNFIDLIVALGLLLSIWIRHNSSY